MDEIQVGAASVWRVPVPLVGVPLSVPGRGTRTPCQAWVCRSWLVQLAAVPSDTSAHEPVFFQTENKALPTAR